MQDEFDKIQSKLDKLDNRLDSIDVTLAKQEVSLSEHIRRTRLNEESIEILKNQMTPISNHVHLMSIFGKIFLAIVCSSGFYIVLEKLLR